MPYLREVPVLVGKRRSDRILAALPIRVSGCEPSGTHFSEETFTVSISQQAARFSLSHSLSLGDAVLIKNLRNGREEKFRVIRRCQQVIRDRQEWSVETANPNSRIWSIKFTQPAEEIQPKVLLECRTCCNTEQSPLTTLQYRALLSAGMVSRYCSGCGQTTHWRPNVRVVEREVGLPKSKLALVGGVAMRKIRRLRMAMRVYVRNQRRISDIVQTRDVSKDGLCFVSSREFRAGDDVNVALSFDRPGEPAETTGKIVWCGQNFWGGLNGVSFASTS